MTALPEDVAAYTQDGVLVRSPSGDFTTIRALFPGALDEEESPRESFFRYEADAITVETARFNFLKRLHPLQDEIEVEQSIGVGGTFPVAPTAPKVTVKDGPSENGYIGIVRAFVRTMSNDRYALSVVEG